MSIESSKCNQIYPFSFPMKPYDLIRLLSDFITYQQREKETYQIIVTIETLVIIFLSIELAKLNA